MVRDKKGVAIQSSTARIVLLIVFLVVVLGGIFWYVNVGKQVESNIPQYAERVVQQCSVTGLPPGSLCTQLRKIGKKEYVTCDYAVSEKHLTIKNSEDIIKKCEVFLRSRKEHFKSECKEEVYDKKEILNGKNCEYWKDPVKAEKEAGEIFEGDVEHPIGENIDGGSILVKGDVYEDVGFGMVGGEIIIEGSVFGNIGKDMEGGKIIVKGKFVTNSVIGATMTRIGENMIGGEIIIEGRILTYNTRPAIIGSLKEGGIIRIHERRDYITQYLDIVKGNKAEIYYWSDGWRDLEQVEEDIGKEGLICEEVVRWLEGYVTRTGVLAKAENCILPNVALEENEDRFYLWAPKGTDPLTGVFREKLEGSNLICCVDSLTDCDIVCKEDKCTKRVTNSIGHFYQYNNVDASTQVCCEVACSI